jgi:hypothetical protein
VQFDTALNVIWLSLSVLALASTLRSRRARFGIALHLPPALHVCGVALILAALFPYISATDDIVRIQHHLQQAPDHRGQSGKKCPNESLLRLYEALDTPIISPTAQISFVLLFIAVVLVPLLRMVSRTLTYTSGRSPPFASRLVTI